MLSRWPADWNSLFHFHFECPHHAGTRSDEREPSTPTTPARRFRRPQRGKLFSADAVQFDGREF
jgi:hypothetical protein